MFENWAPWWDVIVVLVIAGIFGIVVSFMLNGDWFWMRRLRAARRRKSKSSVMKVKVG
jgi:putative flippase GtrA